MQSTAFPHFVEGRSWFRYVVPDQLAFLFPMRVFRGEAWRMYQGKGPVTIFQVGGQFASIGLHPECMLPWLPLIVQFAWALLYLGWRGVFEANFAFRLSTLLHPSWNWQSPLCRFWFMSFLREYRVTWYRMEIAYDLPPGTKPFKVLDPAFASVRYGTIYLPPSTRVMRIVSEHDHTRVESKGRRDSLVAIYDRGDKIGSESFLRFEVRLFSRHLKAFDMSLLHLPFWFWLVVNRGKIAKLMSRIVPSGTLGYDLDELRKHNPWLLEILKAARW